MLLRQRRRELRRTTEGSRDGVNLSLQETLRRRQERQLVLSFKIALPDSDQLG